MDGRVALVGKLFMAYQSGEIDDPAALLALISPDIRIEPLSTDLEPGPVYEGLEGLARWAAELGAADAEFQPSIERIEPVGAGVLATGSIRAATAGGLAPPTPTAWAFEFDEHDRLRSMRAYLDIEAARASLT
jgi:hypothetical protein